MRSRRSLSASSVVAGITTAPSFIAASIVSHSSTWLPSISTIRSPRPTPCARSQFASRSDRVTSSSNVSDRDDPSPSTTSNPTASFPRAKPSNQSSAQLNSSSAGHANDAQAASQSSRLASNPSRRALSASMRRTLRPRVTTRGCEAINCMH